MSERVREIQKKAGAMIALANAGKSVLEISPGNWQYKLLLLVVVVYIISPLDFIPDPIIILGWLDDLLVALATASLVLIKANELYVVTKSEPDPLFDVRQGTSTLDQDLRVINTVSESIEVETPAVSTDRETF